jgi:hypothetical protein
MESLSDLFRTSPDTLGAPCAKINTPAGGTDKFFTDEFLLRALGK